MGSFTPEKLENVRRAREEFLTHGIIPAGVVNETILRSWQRSAERGIGIERGETRCTPRYDLMQRRENNHTLLSRSQPVMESLYHEIAGSSSMVLLADSDGVVLHSIGDPDFVEQAQKVFLKPGGIWSERVNGTNAIGTALEEQMTVQVHSSEHFIDKNRFLSCCATPIFNPRGGILGALDVSGDYRVHQQHTTALVRLSAQMIENQMFVNEFPEDIIVSFHLRPEFIGSLYEGIAVFTPDGTLVAANRSALLQLGLDRFRMTGHSCYSLFRLTVAELLGKSRAIPQPVLKLSQTSGTELYGRVWPGRALDGSGLRPAASASTASAAKNAPLASKTKVYSLDELEHGDPKMQALLTKARRVVGHDIPIMIEGESGTGKELLAHALHMAGPRSSGPFIPINCAAIPEGLIESELFGYQEGAFTGARRKGQIGKIREADQGTLFLDEIGEMPLQLQARLLRVLQDRKVSPLGGGSHQVDIAVICATNRRVRDAVAAGSFREDLYYRLNGMLLALPSLKEREDRLLIAKKILEELAGAGRTVHLSPEVLEIFGSHPWPGNIRQMHNVLRTALALLGEEHWITEAELPEDFIEQAGIGTNNRNIGRGTEGTVANDSLLSGVEARLINSTLERTEGNIAAAARMMGIGRNTLYRKLRGLNSQNTAIEN